MIVLLLAAILLVLLAILVTLLKGWGVVAIGALVLAWLAATPVVTRALGGGDDHVALVAVAVPVGVWLVARLLIDK